MTEEYSLERFKRFVELLGDLHPQGKFMKGFAEAWQQEREMYEELLNKEKDNG